MSSGAPASHSWMPWFALDRKLWSVSRGLEVSAGRNGKGSGGIGCVNPAGGSTRARRSNAVLIGLILAMSSAIGPAPPLGTDLMTIYSLRFSRGCSTACPRLELIGPNSSRSRFLLLSHEKGISVYPDAVYLTRWRPQWQGTLEGNSRNVRGNTVEQRCGLRPRGQSGCHR